MEFKKRRILPLFTTVLLVASQLMTTVVRAEEFVISGNGGGSSSEISLSLATTAVVEQTNNANITNNVDSSANTGGNEANNNSGTASITTGDIYESINVTNTANTIVTDTPCCENDISANISANGEGSNNLIAMNIENGTTVNVNQYANITNSVDGQANTGRNQANNNGGNVSIQTGNIIANSSVKNSPVNVYSATAGSGGGSFIAVISGNGANSQNTINGVLNNISQINANNIFILSNINNWDLNTGENYANGNIGDVSIRTGNIALNILIENMGNVGEAHIDCCEDPNDPGDPGDPGDPTPTPGPAPTVASSSGGGGSTSGSSIGPAILGLSNTSSQTARMVMLYFGAVMMMTGLGIISKGYGKKAIFFKKS
ncbi:MAG TPA: hypothetical protein VFI61_01190 [Patescibacteria group bacterium]|nr:hypothetical protein [Patescibacteria group bacterium]